MVKYFGVVVTSKYFWDQNSGALLPLRQWAGQCLHRARRPVAEQVKTKIPKEFTQRSKTTLVCKTWK